jgi:hypothetical protein
MTAYIIFGICCFLAIFLICWKIKNSRPKDADTSEAPEEKKPFFKRLSEKLWEMEWEAAIPWFWICVFTCLIIYGLYKIYDWSSSERAYWAERVYWAEQVDKIHQKTLARAQTAYASTSIPQLIPQTLPTPKKVMVEKESESGWRVILPANKIAQTEIQVAAGEKFMVKAFGLVKWNSYLPPTNPKGWSFSPREKMTYPESFIAPDEKAGMLLLKISEKIIPIGRGRVVITAPIDGKLIFLINDQLEHFSENTGSFEIHVTKFQQI